ncbi:MAG: PKD domain-containing protein [Bacteroidetes bacterium]|nr:PKD domain-containing protein [Bacteroidota bacterium]
MTLNAGTSTINLTGNNLSFSPGIGFGGGGGLTYYDLNFPGPCKSGLIQSAMNFHNVSFATDGVISASCTFNNLTFSPGHEYTLTNGTTQTINGDLNISGSGGFPIRIQSSVAGSRATFSKSSGTVCADYIRISDNQATGGATFNAGTNSQDLGNNIGWNFPGMSTAPSSLNVSVNPLCNTGTQQTHLTQTGGTLGNLAYWQWYSNDLYTIPVGGQLATSDAGLDVSPLITTTYYIRAEWPECISPLPGPPSGITVTVNPLPSAPLSGGNVVICSNDAPGTISATSAGNEIDWYDMSAGGGLLQSNSSTYATSVANTYFAESRNSTTTCVSAIRTPVTLTINNSPVAFNVSGGACVPATMGLTGSEVGVNYQLYRNTNIPVGSIVSGTGNTISFGPQNVPGIYSVVATNAINGCISDMIGVSTVAICTSTWLGTTDTSWFTQTNWDPAAIPNNCASNVVIPVGTPYSPTITGSNVTIGNMDIASGAVLSLLGQNLNVCGNWKGGAGSNAAVVGSGTVVMNSSSGSQSISDNTQFNILQINNADGVHLNSGADVSINNGLHLQLGDLDVSAAALILKSNSSNHNSYIDDFTTGFAGTLTGAIRAERYIPTLGSNQHFMSSPVNSPLLSQLGASGPDGSYVTPYPTCDETKSNWGSAYGTTFVYNDGHMSSGGCMLGNWMIKSGGNMDNGRGYSTYQKGDTTRTLVGAANTGNINIGGLNNSGYPTVNTLQAQPIHSGWNLVGNPYPSALDLTIDRTADGFGDQVQVWHTTGPFSGVWLPVVIDGNSGTVVIAPFQAFMVRVIPGSLGNHTYHFYQSERVRSTNVQFHRVDAANALKLELNYANGGKDETRIAFSSEATINFDNKLDANKPGSASGVPTLYTHMNTNMWYGINTLPSLTEVTTVPMGLRTDMNGTMTITPQGIQSFDPTTYILLEDKKTDTWHNLRNGSYTFTASKTDNQDRFVLHFTPPANILTTDASCSGSGQIEITQPGNANWNYTITDVNSTTISSGQLNSGNPMTISANSGVYQLTLTDNSGYTVMKKIEVKGIQPIVASFAASVTLAEVNEEINFSATTTNVATYHWDFGDGNTATTKNATHFYRAEGSYSINLTVINSTGCKSNTTQTVNITSRGATGISTMLTIKPIHIWSSENMVYVDFTNQKGVQAEIALYNLLGEVISCEKFVNASVYKKQITDLQAAYIIVRVKNEESVTTKKVFIVNN